MKKALSNLEKLELIKNLAQIARDNVSSLNYWPDDLGGACAIASIHLMNLAFKENIRCTFAAGLYNNLLHCWIEYNDLIIDITATQFGIADKVHITSKKTATNYNRLQFSRNTKDAVYLISSLNYPLALEKKEDAFQLLRSIAA